MNLRNLKRKYRNVVRGGNSTFENYCVGGAFCLEVGAYADNPAHQRFPSGEEIYKAVLRYRSLETYELSDADWMAVEKLGYQVEKLNDAGEFDLAWRALSELLHYKFKGGFQND